MFGLREALSGARFTLLVETAKPAPKDIPKKVLRDMLIAFKIS
jgi:hypothetical protein